MRAPSDATIAESFAARLRAIGAFQLFALEVRRDEWRVELRAERDGKTRRLHDNRHLARERAHRGAARARAGREPRQP
jgi:hypothetical protein